MHIVLGLLVAGYFYALDAEGMVLSGRIAPKFTADELASIGASSQIDEVHPSKLPGDTRGPDGELQVKWDGEAFLLVAPASRKVAAAKVVEVWRELRRLQDYRTTDATLLTNPALAAAIDAEIEALTDRYVDLKSRMK